MKPSLLVLLILLNFKAAFAAAALKESLARGGNELQGPELTACNAEQTQCLRVKAANAIESQVQAIQQMKQPHVEYQNRKEHKTEQLEGTSGYIDLANNNLVIYVRKNKTLKEIEFNLKTLHRSEQIIR